MKGRPADPGRVAARAAGMATYQGTGLCRSGHASPLRYTSTAACVECVKSRDKGRTVALQPA